MYWANTALTGAGRLYSIALVSFSSSFENAGLSLGSHAGAFLGVSRASRWGGSWGWSLVLHYLFRHNHEKKHASSTFVFMPMGSFRSYDSFCNENTTYNRTVLPLFHVGHVVQNRRSMVSLAWHEWFSCRGREWKIYCCGLVLYSEPQITKFHVVVWQTTSKNCTKLKHAARAACAACAARLFFLVQPIKALICGVVVVLAVPVVVSLRPG